MSVENTLRAMLKGIEPPPSAILLGAKFIEADIETGRVVMEFEGKPEFLNPAGVIQGGIVAAMLDDTMGPCVMIASRGQAFASTIDLNVSFLAPAKPGKLIGRGEIVQLGTTIAFLQATIEDAEGRIVARSTSSARLVKGLFPPPPQS